MKPYNGYTGIERQIAFHIQNEAIHAGKLVLAQNCEMCGQPNLMTAHLEDYDQPLKPHSLCIECHMNLHLRFEHPLGWILFLEKLRAGYKPADYETIKQYYESDAAKAVFKTKGKPAKIFESDPNKWYELLLLEPINYRVFNNEKLEILSKI